MPKGAERFGDALKNNQSLKHLNVEVKTLL